MLIFEIALGIVLGFILLGVISSEGLFSWWTVGIIYLMYVIYDYTKQLT
jgi:hypothetical protein